MITAIACSSVSSSQAFPIHAPAFPSQAERTLECYKSGGGYNSDAYGGRSNGYHSDRSNGSSRGRGLGQRDACFGCKSPDHPWIHNGVIVCPNANAPGICTEAARAYEEWREKSKSKREQRKCNRSVDYNTLSDRNKEKVKEAVLASLASDDATCPSPATTPLGSCKKPMILVADVVVLSSASPTLAILSAPIVSNFPHIHLQLGTVLDCPNCPVIQCVIDTAAALSTGNFHFVAAVAKQYQHCVAKLFVPKDYNPIVLSGIVQRGSELVTTELTMGFQFHLPYLTKEGNTTSILIATGPHVTVNTIVGLPFIQATRAVINLADNVAELRTLNAPPFPSNIVAQWCMFQLWMRATSIRSTWWTHTLTSLPRSIHWSGISRVPILFKSDPTVWMEGAASVLVLAQLARPIFCKTTLQSALTHSTEISKSRFVGDPMDPYNDPDMGIGFDNL